MSRSASRRSRTATSPAAWIETAAAPNAPARSRRLLRELEEDGFEVDALRRELAEIQPAIRERARDIGAPIGRRIDTERVVDRRRGEAGRRERFEPRVDVVEPNDEP